MFNIGGGEFLAIAVIALIVLGPQRLPDAARQVGKAMGELRKLSSGFQNEIRTAFDASEEAPRVGPRRDVLRASDDSAAGATATDKADAAAADAIAAVSRPPDRPARRTPLVAAPAEETTGAGSAEVAPAPPRVRADRSGSTPRSGSARGRSSAARRRPT